TLRARTALLDRVHAASVSFTGGPICALPPKVEEAILRVAEEALHNALRHGQATNVSVSLRHTPTGTVLEVVDDGMGFDTAGVSGSTNRLGLASMRERSRSVHGTLKVESRDKRGTTVTLTVPANPSRR